MNIKKRLVNTALIGMTVATLGLSTSGTAAEAKVIESSIQRESQPELVAIKFKKIKKHHKHHSFKKAKKYKKHHHHKKSLGYKKIHLFR